MDIVLASTSPYRKQLMKRLQIVFSCQPPAVDEYPLPDEQPAAMAQRLARAKAQCLVESHPDSIIIGSDQVASIDGYIMGKPGDHRAATAQLRASSGREVRFDTAISLVHATRGIEFNHVEQFSAYFRTLSDRTIEDYLQREKPYDCAGSFKCEGLGIALFERLQGNDPTSLEGLPLMALTSLLAAAGVNVLAP